MLLRIIRRLQWIRAPRDLRFRVRRRPVVNYDLDKLPPGPVRTFPGMEVQLQRLGIGMAAELLPQELPALISESVTIIPIDHPHAVVARIHSKLQRSSRSFFRTLNHRLDGQNTSSAHIDRQRIELRMHLAWLGEFRSGLRVSDIRD